MSSSRFAYRFFIFIGLLTLALHGPIPSRAQAPARLLIESDEPRVIQSGTWSNQNATAASGSRYLYSSGAEEDVLALAFMGSAVEVIYVAGPQFGTLAIEVDGTVLRTVITTADKIEYGQVAQVDYLSDEPHTLKVYAQAGGVIAIDAFQVTPLAKTDRTPPIENALATGDDGGTQPPAACSPTSTIQLISKSSSGTLSNSASSEAEPSADGRFVVFISAASTLVTGDTNGFQDVFVYDRQTCNITRVSVATGGGQANGNSYYTAISADGRFVVFSSEATNLVAGDTNSSQDVFVHDRQTTTTTRVSVATGGGQGNALSALPAISADGRFVAFSSEATNLVTGDTNSSQDVFVHDRQTSTTTRVSVATGGGQANQYSSSPVISANGRFVAFNSAASNLVTGDTNGSDIFVYDRQTSTTTRVSVATGGAQANQSSYTPSISADGRFVTFYSEATNLVTGDTNGYQDIFVHDRQVSTTTRISVATGGIQATGGHAYSPAISGDGRFVTFFSEATNLVTGDTNGFRDVFVHDRQTTTTTRVSVTTSGAQANFESQSPSISADGRYIAFESRATNLVAGDTNAVIDVFVTPVGRYPTDTLALFNPTYQFVALLNTLADNPPPATYDTFSAYAPITGGQWVMGDWNGDRLKTPGVYLNGAFFYTNKADGLAPSDWASLWIGISGPAVTGRFNGTLANDCIGAVQAANFPPHGTAFAFYFTCDLSGNTTPALSNQFLGVILPDSGFSGVHQFGAGDFDGDGVESIAVRRGMYVAFGNVPPTTSSASMSFAQFLGAPSGPDAGTFVVGNWDGDAYDSFGLFYQNGEFFYRNDLLFNSGAYGNQSVGQPFAGTVQATTWR